MIVGLVVTPVSPCYRVSDPSALSVAHAQTATWDENGAIPERSGPGGPFHAHRRPPLTPPCHPPVAPDSTCSVVSR